MGQSASIRIERGVSAGLVVLAHVLLVWIIVQTRTHTIEIETTVEPVMATLIEQPRYMPPGVLPVEVKSIVVRHLQSLAPKIPEIAEEPSPEPISDVELTSQPVTASVASSQIESGTLGVDNASSGPSGATGGGRLLMLVQRVVPKYPVMSARKGEQGGAAVHLRVDENGRVAEARLARSSGFSRLDQAAIDAVRKWRFAAAPRGTAPKGTWGQTEVHFVLYRFTYSRLGSRAMDGVYDEQVKAGDTDEATPGSDAALKRFIADVMAGAITGDPDPEVRNEVAQMRTALAEWGEVKSMGFNGAVGERSWVPYDIKPLFRTGERHATIEVKWDMYEVRHRNATSEWLVAVDREGKIWNAQAGPAPAQ